MTLRTRHIALAAGLGSLGMLLGAWGFQYLGDLSPCPMCIWQRWPHAVAALLGLVAFVGGPMILWGVCGAITMAVSAALGLYHSGVERDWWQGPSTCTSGDISNLTPDQLMAQIMSAPLVRCDEIVWDMFGLTMPNWNALISLGFCALWIIAIARRAD